MQLYYFKPELEDLSQGSRIAFVRQFRFMTQDSLPYCIETFGKERAPYISSKESIIKELDESIPYLIDEVKVNPILSPDDYNDEKRM